MDAESLRARDPEGGEQSFTEHLLLARHGAGFGHMCVCGPGAKRGVRTGLERFETVARQAGHLETGLGPAWPVCHSCHGYRIGVLVCNDGNYSISVPGAPRSSSPARSDVYSHFQGWYLPISNSLSLT